MSNPQPQVIRQQGPSQNAQLGQLAQGFSGAVIGHRKQEHDFRMANLQEEAQVIEMGIAQYDGDVASFAKAHPGLVNSWLGHLYDGDEQQMGIAYRNLTELPATAEQVVAGAVSSLARRDINETRRALINPPKGPNTGIGEQVLIRGADESLAPEFPWRTPESVTPQQPSAGDGDQTAPSATGEVSSTPREEPAAPPRQGVDAVTPEAPIAEGIVFQPPKTVPEIRAQREELEERMNDLREINPEEADRVYQYYQQLGEYETQLEQYNQTANIIQDARSGSGTPRAAELLRTERRLEQELLEVGRSADSVTQYRRRTLLNELARTQQEIEQLTELSQAPIPEPPKVPQTLRVSPRPESVEGAAPSDREVQRQRSQQLADTPAWDRETQRMLRQTGAQEGQTGGATRSFSAPEEISTPQDYEQAQEQTAHATAQEVAANPIEPATGEARPYLADFHITGKMEPRQVREYQRDTAQDMRRTRAEFRTNPELREGSVRQQMAERGARVLAQLHDPERAAIWTAIEPSAIAEERERIYRRQLDTERLDLDIKRYEAGHDIDLARLEISDRDLAFRMQQAELAMHAAAQELPPTLKWQWDNHSAIQKSLIDGLIEDHGANPDRLNREFEKLIETDVWKTSQAALAEVGEHMGFGPGITQVTRDGGFFSRLFSFFGGEPAPGWREQTPEERGMRSQTAEIPRGTEPNSQGQSISQAEQYMRMQNMIQ